MADGSGLRTARANKTRGATRRHLPFVVLLACLILAPACVYFNALYNANKAFEAGRRDVEEGRLSSGLSSLETSIEKAERIVADNPDSRWADDALRLIIRARLLREEWRLAAEASQTLFQYARSARDSAEVAGWLGTAETRRGNAALADSLLTIALSEVDERKARAELLFARGLARKQLKRVDAALADLEEVSGLRPEWVRPRLERISLLIDDQRENETAFALATLWELNVADRDEAEVIKTVGYVATRSPETALLALSNVEQANLLRASRAQLLKLRGDLHMSRGTIEKARSDYGLVPPLAGDLRVGAEAQLAVVRLDLAQISTVEEFRPIVASLERVGRQPAGQRSSEVRRLLDMFIRMVYWIDAGDLGYMLAAETARDELAAPRLARYLFVQYVETQPQSVWAPKAILAVLDLDDLDFDRSAGQADNDERGSEQLRQRLYENYRSSPYVGAVLGEKPAGRFTYEELEEGLRRQLDQLEKLANDEVRARRQASSQP